MIGMFLLVGRLHPRRAIRLPWLTYGLAESIAVGLQLLLSLDVNADLIVQLNVP